ncbi:MAG: triose-phosphate isomerase [Pseudobdellovibrionaceae bacterium]
MKKLIFAANWKMHKSPSESRSFVKEVRSTCPESVHAQIILFPSSPCLEAVAESCKGSQIRYGSQNCHFEAQGAFTGEVSPRVVKELGAQVGLVGHSERRTLFGESNELIAQKVAALQKLEMTPMLCIGESLKQREENLTNDVLRDQLFECLRLADLRLPLIVAYEPVWAIGTGKVATPAQVADAHLECRKILAQIGSEDAAQKIPVLYGGSVKADNAKELGSLPNVDGFLIGGASLVVESFKAITAT